MELDVRRVGLQSCFVALPPSLLEILLADNRLPSFPFVLELRPVRKFEGSAAPCFVAWDGAASSSTQIEVPEVLAECIGLSTGTRVRVRARGDVLAAETVVVEPATEDDWEILELNAEYLENHILSKVGVVAEGQQFPVWVTGKVVLTLRVISTSPKGIVKLVPGVELVVAPKKRQVYKTPSTRDVGVDESPQQEADLIPMKEAWLRVQELHSSFVQKLDLPGVACSTTPSTTIFISPNSAKVALFEDGQLVVLSSGEGQTQQQVVGSKGHQRRSQVQRHKGQREGVAYVEEEDAAESDEETPHRDAIVRLKFWEGVAAGHVMVSFPLRIFIGATIHMPVHLQAISLKNLGQPRALVLSPVLFEFVEDDDGSGDGQSNDLDVSAISSSLEQETDEIHVKGGAQGKWQGHRHVLDATTGFLKEKRTDNERARDTRISSLIVSWVDAQVAFPRSLSSGDAAQSVPIAGEAVVHISVGSLAEQENLKERQLSHKFAESSSMPEVFVTTGRNNKTRAKNFLFLLSAFSDAKGRAHDGKQPVFDNRQSLQRNEMSLANVLLLKEMLGCQSSASAQQNSVPAEVTLKQGSPCQLPCISGMNLEVVEGPVLKSLTWLQGPASEALGRLEVLLSPTLRNKLKQLGTPLPGSVLLHGPPACGKTQLALALARELQDDERVLSHRVLVRCSDLVGEQAMGIRRVLLDAVQEAMHSAPSLIVLDDLDVLLPAAESEGPEPGIAVLSIAEFLADLIDICQGRRNNEFVQAAVAFLAVAKSSTALPACLCLSGRFDFHVQLTAPAATERAAILDQIVISRGLRCSESVAARVAASCEGADASDMELVVDRAVHAAASRFLSLASEQLPSQAAATVDVHVASGQQQTVRNRKGVVHEQAVRHLQTTRFELLDQDFNVALKEFVPLAMRGITKAGTQVARHGWEDVGGLYDTRVALQEMLEMPVKYSKIFEQAPLRLRTGVLLYGPPGCGKTHIVGAAAAACSLRLIAVKGPELLNKYIGASEQGVRDVFARATAAAPCILFFDEFDAIAPQRGHDNTGVTDRVVNQLLTELDGVEALNGVFVFAATSRPDLLDAALLRPGRLDRLLICDFPSERERSEILEVLARKLHLADDVDLDEVASLTEGFSAADLQAILSDAQLESVHTYLEGHKQAVQENQTGKPTITMAQLRETAIKARPSVPDNERRRLYGIYDTFIGAKRSLSSKRDVKGKRATLA
ncbi:unnamed protein product [Calypogeia fissa]